MGEQILVKIQKTLAILLVVLFAMLVMAESVSSAPVKPGLTVSFSGSPTSGPVPLTVQFKDHSISNFGITSWTWDFGDGDTSNKQNPKHTYSNRGVYAVKLTIVDAEGSSVSYTKNNYVTVKGIYCDFKASSPTSGDAPLTVNFMDFSDSDYGITSWVWDFGNGITSNVQNPPPIIYNNPGSYTVKLTVVDAAGNQAAEIKNNYIRVR